MILAIIQARVSSSRLPQKVLFPILGVPMLMRQIERVKRARKLDRVMIATSDQSADDAIETLCKNDQLDFYRGNLTDVLDRFYQAARCFRPDYVVRITGDCPLADPALVDELIEFHLAGGYDYSSNTIEPTFPDGLDAEIFKLSCLEEAWKEAKLMSEREHVTPFIYKNPQRYRLGNFKNKIDLSGLRWTVDEAADFELIKTIYEALYPKNKNFLTADVLNFLSRNQNLKDMNTSFKRNEGYAKSLAEDKEIR